MVRRSVLLIVFSFAIFIISLWSQKHAMARTRATTAQLKIGGAVSTPLTLTVADLKSMRRTTIRVVNAYEKKLQVYEGVLLEELLQKAGLLTENSFVASLWPAMFWRKLRMATG